MSRRTGKCRQRCAAFTLTGQPCMNRTRPDSDRCGLHQGTKFEERRPVEVKRYLRSVLNRLPERDPFDKLLHRLDALAPFIGDIPPDLREQVVAKLEMRIEHSRRAERRVERRIRQWRLGMRDVRATRLMQGGGR